MNDLHYTFTCTAAPVQAEGMICGKPFYFRARHQHWSFSVSHNTSVDPAEIMQTSQDGFYLEEQYNDDVTSSASYLSLDEARQIIARCAEMYLKTMIDNKP